MTRRASGSAASAAFGRAFATPTRPAPAPASTPAPVVDITPGPVEQPKPKPSKYTLLLDDADAAVFDGLALSARRQLGRRVGKSDLVRVLVHLAADDSTLLTQVIDELRRRDGAPS